MKQEKERKTPRSQQFTIAPPQARLAYGTVALAQSCQGDDRSNASSMWLPP
jgi:hypothetical protein